MKKTLYESLVDYDMALLRALAEVRGAVLASHHRLTAAEELAQQLATPASLAIALADLSPAEAEALAALLAAGGWMEAPRFARRFGTPRKMGPGRLERQRPWLAPANPAEGLWYRALIFKGFRQTESGVGEVVYIPQDLLPALSSDGPRAGVRDTGVRVQPAPPPPHVQPASSDLVEDVFGVLVTVRNRGVRVKPDGSFHAGDLQAINALCVSPLPAALVADDGRLAFTLGLCRAARLVGLSQGRLTLKANPARAWLQATPDRRLLALQTAWRDDPDWNDLWHVPSLRPQPTGWKNEPRLARRQVLAFLAGCQPGAWVALDDFIAAVKASAPDFQRPDGDYTAWYIHGLDGQPLMGFEHWDQVEGALLRYLIGGPLHWLGVTDVGLPREAGPPTAFRLAGPSLALLELAPPAPAGSTPAPATPPALAVHGDFSVDLAPGASMVARFQLARFADFLGRQGDQVRYGLSPASLARARRQGIAGEQIGAFLARASGGRVPTGVTRALREWQARRGSARLEQGVVLRVDRPETLAALRRQPALARLLGEELGPRAVLVPQANLRQVRAWLAEQGYLEADARDWSQLLSNNVV